MKTYTILPNLLSVTRNRRNEKFDESLIVGRSDCDMNWLKIPRHKIGVKNIIEMFIEHSRNVGLISSIMF